MFSVSLEAHHVLIKKCVLMGEVEDPNGGHGRPMFRETLKVKVSEVVERKGFACADIIARD